MHSEKYENQVFKEKVEILEGSSTFENCAFEKGVYIKDDDKRYFIEGEVVHAIFKSCSFRSQGNEPCVALWDRAQGEFFDCKMISEKYVPVRIDTGAYGVFRNCSISFCPDRCGVAIMAGALGKFEECLFFCNLREDECVVPLTPVYFDANNKEKTCFVNCVFP